MMTPRLLLLQSLAAAAVVTPLAAQSAKRPIDDVQVLADDRWGGRFTGTPGNDSAAAYIARRFAQVGLRPAGRDGWYQPFTIAPDAPIVHQVPALAGARSQNVVGVLPGRDRALRDEYVIVGAHFDHLGLGPFGAMDPDSITVHNGADDNASGTAALIEIARQLRDRGTRRSVLFLAFSGEELGLFGSAQYVKAPVLPLDRATAMVNLDMVGRLRNDRLIVYGVQTAAEFPALLDSLNRLPGAGFDLKAQGDGYGPSDHASFYAAKKPVLHVFTDLHEDYHRSTDDADRINAPGLERVATYTAQVVKALADRPAPLTFVDLPPPVAAGSSRGGSGSYLGSIPDMTESPGGVRLTGVRAGSPAEQAGIRAGDIITRIGDYPVADLQGMTDAMRNYKPGDTVTIVVLRDGQPVSVTATFGRRGG